MGWLELLTGALAIVLALLCFPGIPFIAESEVKVADDEGGLQRSASCTIPKESGLLCERFATDFLGKHPVIVKASGPHVAHFAEKCSRQALLRSKKHQNLLINVSTANAFTGRRWKELTVGEYLSKYLRPQNPDKQGNETFYLFGGQAGAAWSEFMSDYISPPLPTESLRANLASGENIMDKELCTKVDSLVTSLSFGVAGRNTGVPFHFHGPGFLEVIIGRKRWFLYPPGSTLPQYEPNLTTYHWAKHVLPKLKPSERPLDCILEHGDIIYFPANWMHATLNLDDYNVFVSTFA